MRTIPVPSDQRATQSSWSAQRTLRNPTPPVKAGGAKCVAGPLSGWLGMEALRKPQRINVRVVPLGLRRASAPATQALLPRAILAPLRDEPRFQAVLRQINYPAEWAAAH